MIVGCILNIGFFIRTVTDLIRLEREEGYMVPTTSLTELCQQLESNKESPRQNFSQHPLCPEDGGLLHNHHGHGEQQDQDQAV